MTTRGADPLDHHLVATASGDVHAFGHVYRACSARVFGLALRVVQDSHQAEEVAQEVFLQVWLTAEHFDPRRGSATSWVTTLAHRRAVDRVRSSEATRRRDDADADRGRVAPYDVTAAAVDDSLRAAEMRSAMACLSPAQRQALELAYYGGHTYREVSQLLRVPPGTVKTRIRQGLLRLHDQLATPTPA